MSYKLGVMKGRLSNGYQSDHGKLVHAVVRVKAKRPPCPYNDWGKKVIVNDHFEADVSLCGKKPGRKSVGWSFDSDLTEVNCPRCLKKLQGR